MAAGGRRVVLDTNVVVSSFWGGVPGEVVTAWFAGRYTLLISAPMLAEYHATLARLLPETPPIAHFLHAVYLRAVTVTPRERLTVVRQDPSDDRFLECAVAGRAHCLVSGDRHLLSLRVFHGIPIVTPRAFLDAFLGASP